MWDGVHNYTYDAENRLTKVDNSTTATYVYDANGQRVRKTSTAGTFDFVYDLGGREIAEVNSSDAWDRTEVYAGSKHLATYTGGATGVTYFNHADWLGTERGRSNVAGSICESITSLPFGDGLATSGSCGDPSPMHFTGQEHDPESNLDNFHARYDSTSLGRFMSPDPVGGSGADPQTLNKYAYVRNNPLNFTDPTGEWIQLVGSTPQEIQDDFKTLQEYVGSSGGDVGMSPENDGATMVTFNCNKGHDCGKESDEGIRIRDLVNANSLFFFSGHILGAGNFELQIYKATTVTVSGGNTSVALGTGALKYQAYQATRLLKGLTPTVCGGGVFGYAGAAGSYKGAEGFAGYLGEYDTKTGWSNNGLFEGGTSKLTGGVAVNKQDFHFEPLVFVPLFEFAGLVFGRGGVGFYAGTSRVGGGLYANVTSMLSCEGK